MLLIKVLTIAKVLLCLGLEKNLRLLAHDDELGRKSQDAGLPMRARAPRLKKGVNLATDANSR